MNSDAGISAEFERYEGGSKAGEQDLIEGLVEKIALLQQVNRDAHTGRLHRGTHAKGVICPGASFEVFDVAEANPGVPAGMIARLRQGLYRSPGRYPARVRFANGKAAIQHDKEPDERAMSFSVDLGNGARQDLSMNSAAIFPIPSLAAFNLVFMLSLKEGIKAGKGSDETKKYVKSHFSIVQFLRRLPEMIRTRRKADEVTARKVKSYRQTYYWSGTAFHHGEKDAVKYIAAPCEGEALGDPPEGAGADYLRNDLENWVNVQAKPVSFDFKLQFLDAENMHLAGKKYPAWKWVEDPTLDWDAAGAKDYLVGRLTIPAGSIAADSDDPAVFPAFDVCGNSLEEHKPLGRINRGRTIVELKSRDNRA